MRRIPTTSLRSTLLALLLTLCLALPALAAQKEGLLLVAFGTSVPEAQPALTAIDKEFKAAFPHSPVIWAYTSSIIRAKLEKKGVHIGDVAAGLEELARQKVDVVRVQSLHVVAGEEFSEMERLLVSWLVRHPDSFKAVYLGRPLLESRQDAEDVCQQVMTQFFQQSKSFRFDPGIARFRTYFGRIVRGRIADFYRRKREVAAAEIEEIPVEPEAEQLFMEEWRRMVLREAEQELRQLVTPETFQAYQLFAVQKRPMEKITAYLNCSPNQVYQAKKRCFAKLREILLRMNEQDPELQLELSSYDVPER